jgi:hypothetical protein
MSSPMIRPAPAPALSLSVLLLRATLATAIAGDVAADRGAVDPEDGTLADGVYTNRYFDLAYPLPSGWNAGLEGPPPSYSGFYVLAAPVPQDDRRQTLLITAQDTFFAVRPLASAMGLATELSRDAEADDLTAEQAPAAVTVGGRRFARLELRGSALSRLVLATDIRCHVVSFVIAGSDPASLQQVAASLDAVSRPSDASAPPICLKDYATGATVLRRVEPRSAPPYFQRIPVRIVIGADGKAKHVHVIRAFPEQKRNIEAALQQWEFKPYLQDGRAVEVETGLVFEFKDAPR